MILDGLLELQPPGYGGPTMIITDQASYSDQIFGLFWLLGYQFSPRPAGLPDQRFWRLDPHADYGPLDRLARHRISAELIIEQWEDILRDAGSLSSGTVRASELLRALQGGGNPSRLGRAIAEVGRVAKTLHLLSWIDSEEHRRQTSIGLTRHEGRHSVARIILHGNQGQLRQPYRDGQEDRLGALASLSTRSCAGTPNTSTTPSPTYGPPATTLPTRTSNALTAAARAHQDARQLPLHVAPRNRSRSTPAATRTRRSGLAYVPVPLLPAGRSCRCPSPLL